MDAVSLESTTVSESPPSYHTLPEHTHSIKGSQQIQDLEMENDGQQPVVNDKIPSLPVRLLLITIWMLIFTSSLSTALVCFIKYRHNHCGGAAQAALGWYSVGGLDFALASGAHCAFKYLQCIKWISQTAVYIIDALIALFGIGVGITMALWINQECIV